jgi:drug/metabolite transporter (DMT)-like permease
MPIRRHEVPLLILLLGSLIGSNTALAKGLVLEGWSPLALLLWHQGGAAIVLLAVLWQRGGRLPRSVAVWTYGLALGLLSMSLPSAIAFTVMPHIGAGTYTAMFTLSPLATFALRGLLERRYPGHRRLTGLLLGALGAGLLVAGGIAIAPGALGWLGLALLTPLLIAAGNLVRERWLPQGVDTLSLSTVQPLAQLAILVPLGLSLGIAPALPAAPWTPSDLVLALQVLIALAIYPLFFRLQARADAIALSQIGYVIVAVGVAWGAWLYAEPLSALLLPALLLLFLGLRMVQATPAPSGAPASTVWSSP